MVLGLLVPGLSACSEDGATAESRPGAQRVEEVILVRTAIVERGDLVRSLRATATLESDRRTSVGAEVTGHVTEIHFEIGDIVDKDAVLCVLEHERFRLALDEATLSAGEAEALRLEAGFAIAEAEGAVRAAEVALDEAKSSLARQTELSKKHLVAAGDLEAARFTKRRSEVAVANAELRVLSTKQAAATAATRVAKADFVKQHAELDVKAATIRAPFRGVITARSVQRGDHVSPGLSLFEITDPQTLYAPVYLPQKHLRLLTADMRILVRADALPGIVGEGSVRRVPRAVDPETGNIRLDVQLGRFAVDGGESAESRTAARPAHDPVGLPTAQPPQGKRDRPDETERAGWSPFLPGMFVTLTIVTESRVGVPLVPKKAMRLEEDGAVVFRVDESGVAREVTFAPGLENRDQVEVTGGGLAIGDRVVLVGVEQLSDGTRVREADSRVASPEAGGGDQ